MKYKTKLSNGYSKVICKKCGYSASSFHSLVEEVIGENGVYRYVCKNCGEKLGERSHYGGEVRYEDKIKYE